MIREEFNLLLRRAYNEGREPAIEAVATSGNFDGSIGVLRQRITEPHEWIPSEHLDKETTKLVRAFTVALVASRAMRADSGL